ncbi:MAG: class A beta-lactamase [Sphingomonadaceae bacterium]|nr:class A beta-lactamase [Sphingomonadaceae bacterium]
MKFDRRGWIAGAGALAASACVPISNDMATRVAARLRIAEAARGGTLGAWFVDSATGQGFGYKQDELFPHCSSFKFSLGTLLLARHEAGEINADEHVRWSQSDLVSHSPFTTERLAQGATLRELARTAQITSDNTAANILLSRLGGPEGLTAFWRSLGDTTSRLDRTETELNFVPLGEMRDTTSPRAMATTLLNILTRNVLSSGALAEQLQWTRDTKTGLRRTRGGLPAAWDKGDKTGTAFAPGMGSAYVDIGWFTPPGRAPFTYASYFRTSETHDRADPASEAVLRDCGAVAAQAIRGLPG